MGHTDSTKRTGSGAVRAVSLYRAAACLLPHSAITAAGAVPHERRGATAGNRGYDDDDDIDDCNRSDHRIEMILTRLQDRRDPRLESGSA
jgi:hypothetical protein